MNRLAIRYMLVASLLFAIMNVLVKYIDQVPVAQIVMMRSVVMIIAVSMVMIRLKVKPLGNRKGLLIMRGLFGTLGIAFFFYSVQQMPLASAVTIHYQTPIFTALIAFLVVREKLSWQQISFFLICFLGILLIKGFDTRVENWPLIIGIAGTIAAAAAYNIISYLKETENHLVIMFYFPLVTIPLTLVYILVTGDWVWCDATSWIILCSIGVITYFAQLFLTKAYQIGEVNKVAIISYFGIVYALGFGYFFFGEWYNYAALFGMMLVILGIILSLRYKANTTR